MSGDAEDLVCPKCNGASWFERIQDGEIEHRPCACFKLRTMLNFLGPELARAKHRKSDLFMPELDPDTNRVFGDRTLDNLFIKGVWSEAAQHLRWAISAKKTVSPGFSFKMVNDEKLLRVWLGDFAYNKRSSKVRDEVETYNNLGDLMAGLSLVVIRLGKLGYKNKAAADVLQEALNIRASESKPTWLVEDERYFGEGHLFYSYEVGQYVDENFDVVNVGGNVKEAQERWAALAGVGGDTIALGADTEGMLPIGETQERFVAEPDALEDRGKAYYKKKWRGRGGSNPSGGLPEAL